MSLMKLHEQFIEKANRPMTFGALPVQVREAEVPILPMNRWHESNGSLIKCYRFRRLEDRNTFVMQLLAYESATLHHAELLIEGDAVRLTVQTKDVGKPTELDKEYAKYADVLYRSLIYVPRTST